MVKIFRQRQREINVAVDEMRAHLGQMIKDKGFYYNREKGRFDVWDRKFLFDGRIGMTVSDVGSRLVPSIYVYEDRYEDLAKEISQYLDEAVAKIGELQIKEIEVNAVKVER